ncbi:Protein cms1 [Leucoagaricus gongylophorus]
MADDLDDDFVPDIGGDDAAESVSFLELGQPTPAIVPTKKRKHREKDKQSKKRKFTKPVEPVLDSVADQSPVQLASHLVKVQAKAFPNYTPIELNDLEISDSVIADTTSWAGTRTLDQLVSFIIQILPTLHKRLGQASKSNGAPTLLFVAGAALRVADVTRVLKDKKLLGEKGGDVAKLFAKHFKLSDHVSYLKRTKVGTAVGTPGRIGKLLCETDAMSISQLTHIIFDVSYVDAKKRNLLDLPETRDEIFKTVLGAPQVLKAIKEGRVQLVFF